MTKIEPAALRIARPLVLGCFAAVAACMTAPTSASADPQGGSDCGLTVRFGSYAMGIDQGAAQAIERVLRGDPAVEQVDRKPWGREGEFDLCAKLARAGEQGPLFDRVRALIPAKPRGPISVSTADGRSFSTPTRD